MSGRRTLRLTTRGLHPFCYVLRMLRRALALPAALALALAPPCTPARPPGDQLFRTVTDTLPGGALLSVWGDPGDPHHAFLAGGYIGVDAGTIDDGRVGRLVEYTTGTFVTRCTADAPLWWTTSADGVVFAAGERGRVVTYANHACSTQTIDAGNAASPPTYWGALALSAREQWLVGGSLAPGGMNGVIVHVVDGVATRETDLPMEARSARLYKIATDGTSLVVTGERAIVLTRPVARGAWTSVRTAIRRQDSTLFTVSCRATQCWAVGGLGTGLIARGTPTTIFDTALTDTSDATGGLSGVWMQDDQVVWAVGNDGVTVAWSGEQVSRPDVSPTSRSLHGVGGTRDVVIAVGGELSVTTNTQRGAILIRGDESDTFTFDGTSYAPRGATYNPFPGR